MLALRAAAWAPPMADTRWVGFPRALRAALQRDQQSPLAQVSGLAGVAMAAVYPIVIVSDIAFVPPPFGGPAAQALALTLLFLPLHVGHVLYAISGAEPAGSRWTLGAMAALILLPAPFLPLLWSFQFHAIAVSALLLLPMRFALAIFTSLLLVQLPLAFAFGVPQAGPYHLLAVAFRSLSSFVIIWLACAVRQLEAARVRLAGEAVVRERLRIDAELREALGESLESIVSGAERACALAVDDDGPIEAALRGLIDRSRRTLAVARRMVSGYQQVSLRAELDTAAALLNAAGIRTRIEVPDVEFAAGLQDSLRAQLRAATANLLRDGSEEPRVIAITGRADQARVEVRAEPSALSSPSGTMR
jgi:two-component system, NarL family, sensor histidine kinase DesK